LVCPQGRREVDSHHRMIDRQESADLPSWL
jgi:hypothetical protein